MFYSEPFEAGGDLYIITTSLILDRLSSLNIAVKFYLNLIREGQFFELQKVLIFSEDYHPIVRLKDHISEF